MQAALPPPLLLPPQLPALPLSLQAGQRAEAAAASTRGGSQA